MILRPVTNPRLLILTLAPGHSLFQTGEQRYSGARAVTRGGALKGLTCSIGPTNLHSDSTTTRVPQDGYARRGYKRGGLAASQIDPPS